MNWTKATQILLIIGMIGLMYFEKEGWWVLGALVVIIELEKSNV